MSKTVKLSTYQIIKDISTKVAKQSLDSEFMAERSACAQLVIALCPLIEKADQPEKEVCGDIALKHGYRFQWMLSSEGDHSEIHGVVLKPDGSYIEASNGWYRTADSVEAAKLAEFRYAREV